MVVEIVFFLIPVLLVLVLYSITVRFLLILVVFALFFDYLLVTTAFSSSFLSWGSIENNLSTFKVAVRFAYILPSLNFTCGITWICCSYCKRISKTMSKSIFANFIFKFWSWNGFWPCFELSNKYNTTSIFSLFQVIEVFLKFSSKIIKQTQILGYLGY